MARRLFARQTADDTGHNVALIECDAQRLTDLASDQFAVAEDTAKTLASIDDKLGQLLDLLKREANDR